MKSAYFTASKERFILNKKNPKNLMDTNILFEKCSLTQCAPVLGWNLFLIYRRQTVLFVEETMKHWSTFPDVSVGESLVVELKVATEG